MATAKTTTKKTPAKKTAARKAPVKSAAVKAKAPTAKPVAKKTTARKAPKKAEQMQSFRVYRSDDSFTNFRITRQTVYWVILIAFIIFAQLWILKLQFDISDLLIQQQASLTDQL